MQKEKKQTTEQQQLSENSKQELQEQKTLNIKKLGRFFFIVFGIYFCYLNYGFYHEKIWRTQFKWPIVLVLFQSLFSFVLSTILLFILRVDRPKTKNNELISHIGIKYQLSYSLTYISGMIFSNWSLQYTAYPTQSLAKSCKVLPVFTFGLIFGKQKYDLFEWLAVGFITAGLVLFNIQKILGSSGSSEAIGLILLGLSLSSDGIQGVITDNLRHGYAITGTLLMFISNLWALIGLTVVCLITGELLEVLNFLFKDPTGIQNNYEIAYFVLLFCSCSAFGHIFIYQGLKVFGPLIISIITATRKFMTVFISILYFKHAMSSLQWLSVILVLAGAFLDFYANNYRKGKEKKD